MAGVPRIVKVTGLHCRQPGGSARDDAANDAADMVLVRVEADSGLVGWGEAYGARGIAPATIVALDSMIAARCLGAELPAPALPETIRRALYGASANGPFAFALSGLDIALWDLHGKMLDQPVHELLDGPQGGSVAAAARIGRTPNNQLTLDRLRVALKAEPAAIVLQASDPELIEAAAGLCAAQGRPLAVDAGCAWRLHQATGMLRRLEPLGLQWMADPVWPPENHAALAVLRERTGVALAAGFHAASLAEFERLMASHCVDRAVLDVTRMGGIGGWVQLAGTAQVNGASLSAPVHGLGPGLLATLHACASLASEALVDYPAGGVLPQPYGQALLPRHGHFALPPGPGLGIDPDPGWLEACGVPS